MKYHDASSAELAPVVAELDALGGLDPNVVPYTGPDNSAEWAGAVRYFKKECEAGDESACAAVPDARESLRKSRIEERRLIEAGLLEVPEKP